MGYLRSLFLVLTIAVQLVTLSYVLVVMGNTQSFDANRSIVNTTDARAVYYLGTVALIMTAGLAVMLWLERRGPPRRGTTLAGRRSGPSTRRSRRGGSGTADSGTAANNAEDRRENDHSGNDDGGGGGGDRT